MYVLYGVRSPVYHKVAWHSIAWVSEHTQKQEKTNFNAHIYSCSNLLSFLCRPRFSRLTAGNQCTRAWIPYSMNCVYYDKITCTNCHEEKSRSNLNLYIILIPYILLLAIFLYIFILFVQFVVMDIWSSGGITIVDNIGIHHRNTTDTRTFKL